jgi:nitroreductase
MSFETIKENILTRRSVRNFTKQEVLDQDILDIIDCARYAPSDTNSQTWEFIAIKNKEQIKQIEELTWNALHEKAADATAKGLEKEGKLLLRSFGPYATAFSNAPVLILCLATPYNSKFREKIFEPIALVNESVWEEEGIKSSSLACQNLMLAAHAKGLASCPMTGPVLLCEEKIKSLYNIDTTKTLNMVIALGHPADNPRMMARKPVEEILTIIK